MVKQKQDQPDKQSRSIGLVWRIAQQVKRFVWKRLPWFPSAHDTAWKLEINRRDDQRKNAKTTPPEDEYVDLRCVWAVEFYPPSHVDKLLDNFRKLGWGRDERLGRHDPSEWLRDASQHGFEGSAFNLGIIASSESAGAFLPRARTAPMPDCVHHAIGYLYSLTPSLLCVVMCFVFEESFRARIDRALRTQRETIRTRLRTPYSYRVSGPEMQKVREIERIRDESASLAGNWFREHLPGVFSSGLLDNELPTCELVTLRKAEPFPKKDCEMPQAPGYLSVLSLDFAPDLWRGRQNTGLKFASFLKRGDRYRHSALTIREKDLDDKQLKAWGGLNQLTSYIDNTVHGLVGIYALWHLLEGYIRSLNKIRSALATESKRRRRQRVIQVLGTLVDNVAYSVDIRAVTADLISSTQEPSHFCSDVAEFDLVRERLSENTFCQALSTAINGRATELNQTERSLRDYLTQYGSLLAATENARTQKAVKWLTYVVVALAGITFITSDAALISLDWIQDRWGEFMAAISAALI